MAKLSSTTLFHFTPSIDTLEKILETGLWPRYCVEHDWGDKDLVIPMVCTCDIPLSEIKFHQEKYGKYGIGLNKTWAKAQGFTPILYVSDKSDICNRLISFLKKCSMEAISLKNINLDERYLLPFLKRYTGTSVDKKRLKLDKIPKFINEHEWRYIPLKKDVNFLVVPKGDGQSYNCDEANRVTSKMKLTFQPKSIEYIFIQNESERIYVINMIERIYKGKHNDEVKTLISKIISREQIVKDF